ncbi:conserved hypothetical protein [Crocosphaera subtropica ATCC 51142]|uniref:DUF2949 domain-containing protein n=2 Tax=Crocosphaera subtropica (strain ATCC 51142 / BH68) TaxID=43989 RepID=B1WPB9_CROS5|nr:conserved hypothetical protein [Crocosphaera subtropica ATCC 51142]
MITERFSAVMENNSISTEFSQFLQQEMALSRDDLAVVINNQRQPGDPIPMLLWQYGLISVTQLQRIWDWLDAQVYFQFP